MEREALSEIYLRLSRDAAEKYGFAVMSTPVHWTRAELLGRVRAARQMRREFALESAAKELHGVIAEAERLDLHGPLVEALIALADILHHAGDWSGAEKSGRRAIECAEQMGDRDALARARLQVALTEFRLGRNPGDMLQAADNMPNLAPGTVVLAKYVQAKIAHARCDLEGARTLLTDALAMADATQDRHMQCRVRVRLGFIERLSGHLDRAEEHSAAGLVIAQAEGFPRLAAYCLLDLGLVSLKRDEEDKAITHLREALRRFSDLGHLLGTAHAASALGAQARLRGELDEAEMLQRCALPVYIQYGHGCGQALAHKRLGEILRDAGQYKEAHAHLAAAIAEYRQLESLDGEAVSLAALAKLERFRLGSRQALPLALAAVDKLSEMAGRFCQGVDRRQFSQLHSWCYSLAFLCAAESGNAQAALKVAAVVQADKYGKRVRELLLDSDNAELRKIGRQIVSTEVSLNGSAEEPLGRSATTAAALRWTLDRLFEQLRGADAEVADSFPREVSMPPLPPPLAGHDRLTIFGYEEVVPPRLDRGVIVVWEDSTTSSISKTALSPDEWNRFDALCRAGSAGEAALGAVNAAEQVRFADLLLPDTLKDKLLADEVRCLELWGECLTFPLGACLVAGQRVDSMTVIEEHRGRQPELRKQSH